MFIQIAPRLKVYVTEEQMSFVRKYMKKEFFRDRDLPPEELHMVKILADKCIYVRKKLDNGMQYALNRRIKFLYG